MEFEFLVSPKFKQLTDLLREFLYEISNLNFESFFLNLELRVIVDLKFDIIKGNRKKVY
jgi:hypothetical protein